MDPYSNIPYGTDKREIKFRNGYGRGKPEFIALCTLDIKTGREEWGAEPGKEYYTLKMHEIRMKVNCSKGEIETRKRKEKRICSRQHL